jgi:tetratricopeptide (TPR) repeat protein
MKNVLISAAGAMMAASMMFAQATLPGAAPAAAPAAAGPSADEIKDIQAIQSKPVANAADATARMSAVTAFVAKYPTSQFNGYALTMAGEAAQGTGNSAQARFFYEKAIAADPKSDYAMIMLGADIAQNVKPNQMDKAAQLTRATKLANDALALIAQRVKNPGETEEQFKAGNQSDTALAHLTLGLALMADDKFEPAGKEFLVAAQGDAMSLLRAGMAFNNGKKFDDADAALNQFLAIAGVPDQYKKMAEDEKKRGQALKSGK